MNELKIEVPFAPLKSDVNAFYQSVHEENQARGSHAEIQVRPSFRYIFLRDSEGGIRGGAAAHFVFDVVYADAIWVHTKWRRQGAGARLYQAVEDLARTQRKQRAIVTTFEYQAATGFWSKMGFTKFAELPGAIEGSGLIYMCKQII